MQTLLNLIFAIPPDARKEVPEIVMFLQSAQMQKDD
jgi:hypothetical protein